MQKKTKKLPVKGNCVYRKHHEVIIQALVDFINGSEVRVKTLDI